MRWRGMEIDPDNPPKEYQIGQIHHLFHSWTKRLTTLDDVYERLSPDLGLMLKDWVQTWEKLNAPRIVDLKEKYFYADKTVPDWWYVMRGRMQGARLTVEDKPEELKTLWEECRKLDEALGFVENLAKANLQRIREGKHPPPLEKKSMSDESEIPSSSSSSGSEE